MTNEVTIIEPNKIYEPKAETAKEIMEKEASKPNEDACYACDIVKNTKLFKKIYSDKKFIILKCPKHTVPVLVMRKHEEITIDRIEDILYAIRRKFRNLTRFYLDFSRDKNTDGHFVVHIRRKNDMGKTRKR